MIFKSISTYSIPDRCATLFGDCAELVLVV